MIVINLFKVMVVKQDDIQLEYNKNIKINKRRLFVRSRNCKDTELNKKLVKDSHRWSLRRNKLKKKIKDG